jgi:hypothetical protein
VPVHARQFGIDVDACGDHFEILFLFSTKIFIIGVVQGLS